MSVESRACAGPAAQRPYVELNRCAVGDMRDAVVRGQSSAVKSRPGACKELRGILSPIVLYHCRLSPPRRLVCGVARFSSTTRCNGPTGRNGLWPPTRGQRPGRPLNALTLTKPLRGGQLNRSHNVKARGDLPPQSCHVEDRPSALSATAPIPPPYCASAARTIRPGFPRFTIPI